MSANAKSVDSGHRMMWFKTPPAVYFGHGGTREALSDIGDAKLRRAFLIVDRSVHDKGYTKIITEKLEEMEVEYELYTGVKRATSTVVESAIKAMQVFNPDCIVAMGGGSVIDVAKICRVIYDPSNPHSQLSDLFAYDHMQLLHESQEKTGVAVLPPCDKHVKKLVCIPTTSGTGSEMTPIAWVVDEQSNDKWAHKRPIVTWRMTPDIAINDGYFTSDLPKEVVIAGGLNAFVCAVESLGSKLANDYTYALSYRAAKLLYSSLIKSVEVGDRDSRCNCHNGASIAGMAAANAFVGIGHALSFVLQQFLRDRAGGVAVSQGIVSAMVINQVVKFNAARSLKTAKQYALLAEQLAACESEGGELSQVKALMQCDKLIAAVQTFKTKLGVKPSLKEMGVPEDEFNGKLQVLAEETLKVVGCAATNPVEVTLDDAKKLLSAVYSGSTDL